MGKFLAMYGLKPIIVDKCEEFVFGNCETELLDEAFMYPVFFDGKIVDVIDIARISPECPPLVSKKLMKKWDVSLDFGEQKAHVKKHE